MDRRLHEAPSTGDVDELGELVTLDHWRELAAQYSARAGTPCPMALERGDRPHAFAYGCCRDAAAG